MCLVFYASGWTKIALREHISEEVGAITDIRKEFLAHPAAQQVDNEIGRRSTVDISVLLAKASIAERMSWVSKRETTREEDIIKRSDDQSIFAWKHGEHAHFLLSAALAPSPASFADSVHIIPRPTRGTNNAYIITNRGLQITLPMLREHAVLACGPRDDPTVLTTLQLSRMDGDV